MTEKQNYILCQYYVCGDCLMELEDARKVRNHMETVLRRVNNIEERRQQQQIQERQIQ